MKTKIPRLVWHLLIIAWLAIGCQQFLYFSYGMMIPSIKADLNLDYAAVGLIGSAAGIASLIFTIQVPFFVNLLGVKKAMPLTIGISAVGTLIFGLATNSPALVIGRILIGMVANAIAIVIVTFKIGNVPLSRMLDVNGTENFVQPIAQTLAPLLITQVMALVGGWQNVYLVMAAVLGVLTICWLIAYQPKKLPEAEKNDQPVEPVFDKSSFEALRTKTPWLLAIGWTGVVFTWIGMLFYWPSYAQTSLGMTASQTGIVLSCFPLFSALGSLIAPRITQAVGYEKPLISVWGFLLPLFFFGMVKSTSLPLLLLSSAAAGFGTYFFVPLIFSLLYKIDLKPKSVSLGTSMMLTGAGLGSALGSAVIGLMITHFDGDMYKALAISCLAPLVFGILTLFIPERGRKWAEKQSTAAPVK